MAMNPDQAHALCYMAFGKGASGTSVGASAIEAMKEDYLVIVGEAASEWNIHGGEILAYAQALGTLSAASAITAKSATIEETHWREAYSVMHSGGILIPCPIPHHD